MDWMYVYRDEDGRLRDEHRVLCNANWPAFASDEEAEDYIEENDIRINIGIEHYCGPGGTRS